MKKIIAVIPITILFILLSQNIIVKADAPSEFTNVVIAKYPNGNNNQYAVFGSYDPLYVQYSNGYVSGFCGNFYDSYDDAYQAYIDNLNLSRVNYFYALYDDSLVVLMKGSFSYNNFTVPDDTYFPSNEAYQDYVNPPSPEPTWYDNMFEAFLGAVEGIASIATGGFSNLVEAFTEFWVVPVGGDEGDMFFPTDIPMATPTPTPTPIQYQTVIAPTTDPQGNVYYEYKYVYNNPSGTPIVTSSPPVNNNGGGDSFDYPYYENPENNNNPYKLKIPWYLKLIFGDKIVDETTLDDSVNVIQDYMNDDDINDGVTTVYDGMSAIPTDWLILIGVIASIPLFGCLISRLLS